MVAAVMRLAATSSVPSPPTRRPGSFSLKGYLNGNENTGWCNINAIQLRNVVLTDPLQLTVNTNSGLMTVSNDDMPPITLDSYEIVSDMNSLDADGWFPIADGAAAALGFPQGTGSGNGWEASPNADSSLLREWYLQGESDRPRRRCVVHAGQRLRRRGRRPRPGVPLPWRDDRVVEGDVVYDDSTVECDFNGDSMCNIDDLNAMLAEGPIQGGVAVTPVRMISSISTATMSSTIRTATCG